MKLSLSWFKEMFRTEQEKERETLLLKELELRNALLNKQLNSPEKVEETSIIHEFKKPFRRLKLVNNVLTIVLNDGSVLTKPNATEKDFNMARICSNEEQLIKIASSDEGKLEKAKREVEAKKVETIIKGIEILKNNPDFVFEDDSVYMKSQGKVIKRSMPNLLVEKFAQVSAKNMFSSSFKLVDNVEYQALKKFWLKCCLNPNAKSTEDLYTFLANHHFKIDKHGNFYAYRRVVSRQTKNKELVEFVSNVYNKVKAVWKKKPSNFEVYTRLGDFKIIDINNGSIPSSENPYWTLIGNLQDLYLNLPTMQEKTYTSAHTGQEDYRIGEVISMPRDRGDDNNNISCSKGFHAASKAYDYSGFGDTPILVIINPMDVLAVPVGEVGKLRTCRWFFATTLLEDEEHILDDEDFDVSELGDIFEEKCLEGMQEYVQNSFAEEVKRHTFQIPTINASEVTNIVTSLEKMKEQISNRIRTYAD